MKKKDSIYLAALLHDIGKFFERSKFKGAPDITKEGDYDYRYGHSKYTKLFFDFLSKQNENVSEFVKNIPEVSEIAAKHHESLTNDEILEKIIQLADRLSSAERESNGIDCNKKNDKRKYYETPLVSIFSKELYMNLDALGGKYDAIFPEKDFPKVNLNYQKLFSDFYKEFLKLKNDTQLYYLLLKYCSNIPSNTTKRCSDGSFATDISDISLFDHSKTTAAIAVCLYDEFKNGALDIKEINKYLKNEDDNKEHFLLIKADFSGIQDFIFDVVTKGAAKQLKGRSFYIELLSYVISDYILKELDLRLANLLYRGGGNFYILAPYSVKDKFIDVRKTILSHLLKAHKGNVYAAMGYVGLTVSDFKSKKNGKVGIATKFVDVGSECEKLKNRKWSELDFSTNYDQIFNVEDKFLSYDNVCRQCGYELGANHKKLDDIMLCEDCYSFITLGAKLKNKKYLVIRKGNNSSLQFFKLLGYDIIFTDDINDIGAEDRVYVFNDFNFVDANADGVWFSGNHIPAKSFEDIAGKYKSGTQKPLGVLKLDVDNLGTIFAKQGSISKVMTLSRVLSLFFEGYIYKLIESKGWKDDLYVVFAGGDDVFVLGEWEKLWDFAKELRYEFNRLVLADKKEFSKDYTFSASFIRVNPHTNMLELSNLAEEYLEDAKNYNSKRKDYVYMLIAPIEWENIKWMEEVSEVIEAIVGKNHRGVIFKIDYMTKEFKKLLTPGSNPAIYLWRMNYYLRNIVNSKDSALVEAGEKLIKYYEDAVRRKNNMKNPMILKVANRLAEIRTKK